MDGEKRREQIIEWLKCSSEPLSGTALARKAGVSRQVIVQDIALLRATNKNILSTNKGYIYYRSREAERYTRVIAVKHDNSAMGDELNSIVDAGARVLDVIVEHDVYGQIAVDLLIESRRDVNEFIVKISGSRIKPLKELTDDHHYHTIDAPDESILDEVEAVLKEKGYLILNT